MKVREIIGFMDITAVPRTPPHVKGVINLRGQVISVVDLRSKFAHAQPRADRADLHHRRRDDRRRPQGQHRHHRRSRQRSAEHREREHRRRAELRRRRRLDRTSSSAWARSTRP
ncbi:MAG: chemotaxis protein CheW [Rubrivivax sp.]